MSARIAVPAAVPLLVVVIGVIAAGCGSGQSSPNVASLGTTATTGTTTPSSQSVVPPAGAAGGGNFRMRIDGGLKFSECMRAHGVPNFPDPNSQGAITIGSGQGIDPSSPAFQSAQKACQKTLPNGGQPTPQQLAKAKTSALAMSACMRAHGIKDFPDPTFSNGGIGIHLNGSPGSDLNPNNPAFQKAQSACGGKLLKP